MTGLITNKQHQTNFRLDIPDGNQTIQFQIAAQRTSIPGMRIESIMHPTNQMSMGQIPSAVTHFDPLVIGVLTDEDMESYLSIYEWMLAINDYRNMNSTAHLDGNSPKTVLLHVLDNSKTKIVCTFKFHDAWPSELGQLEFAYNDIGNNPIIFDVTFQYKSFTIEKDGVIIGGRNKSVAPKLGMHPSMR